MLTNLYQKLAVATAGTALSLFALEATPAGAATITYDFTVDITSGPLSGNEYNGFFSYDDTAPSEVPDPYFDVSEFNFDFVNTTAFEEQWQNRTYTRSDLFIDGRQFPYSLPLRFDDNGEIIEDESGNTYLIPRGRELLSFEFSTFKSLDFDPQDGWWTLSGNRQSATFNYVFGWQDLLGAPEIGGLGTVKYAIRSIPEPNTVLGLSLLGAGWLLKKKRSSSRMPS